MTAERSGETKPHYVPALGFDLLTPVYDPVVALSTRERAWKRALVAQARLEPGQRVLDLACGTGTLAIEVKRAHPKTRIVGLDADPRMLDRARKKAHEAGVGIEFEVGRSTELPYPDASFERVLSTLFFHHLSPAAKRQTAAEILRVLVPGGELHLADWGRAANPLMRFLYLGVQILDGFDSTAENVRGRLPEILESAGFVAVAHCGDLSTLFGTMTRLGARKAEAE